MFSKLKKLLLGNNPPIVRSITHPVIGTLVYSEDHEAWLTDPKKAPHGFGFYIAGDWDTDGPAIHPSAPLVQHAAEIASHPEVLKQSMWAFIESQLKTVKSLAKDKDEVEKLQIYCVNLMWRARPNDGEIELRTSLDTDRTWHCAYIDRKPARHLALTGLDR